MGLPKKVGIFDKMPHTSQMGKYRIFFAALILFAIGVGAWMLFHPRELTYQGKPVSEWLQQSRSGAEKERDAANVAIREMGTNAIPTLLRMLRRDDSAVKVTLVSLARKQPWFDVPNRPPIYYYTLAAHGFEVLGPQGAPAVPELIDIFDRNISPLSQRTIAQVLGSIGPAAKGAVPALLRGAGSTNQQVRNSVFVALGQIHAEPDKVILVLTNAFFDLSMANREAAGNALANFGPDAQSVVPGLLELLRQERKLAPPEQPPSKVVESESPAGTTKQIDNQAMAISQAMTSSPTPVMAAPVVSPGMAAYIALKRLSPEALDKLLQEPPGKGVEPVK